MRTSFEQPKKIRLKEHPIQAIKKVPTQTNGFNNSPDAAFVLIERRLFIRECMRSGLSDATGLAGVGVSDVDEHLANTEKRVTSFIVICAIGATTQEIAIQLQRLKDADCSVPIAVISDKDDIELVMMTIEKGANGFVPFDTSLKVAAYALRLVSAGGQYFPAVSLLAARRPINDTQNGIAPPTGRFTRRQVAVIDALRRGKANKVIAYELNMCESTVKVHVRNIMKKLNAKNRTEVAYLSNELLREYRH
jgi:DNA-binding NarL/FixJ family response regulator